MRRSMFAPLVLLVTACSGDPKSDVDRFLADYGKTYQQLFYEQSRAEWASNTHIVEGDTTNSARTKTASEALARFTGSVGNIDRVRAFLRQRERLTPLQVRTLEAMLYLAAENPQTVPNVVSARIAAETEQVEKLYGYQFTLNGQPVTPNRIDEILRTSRDLTVRRAAWEASNSVGPTLKPGLLRLRDLRDSVVRALGYSDYFTYQVSDYGMTTPEMLALCDTLIVQLRPLYRELHTWARYELAQRYHRPVPEELPADWLPNRWGQDWSDLVSVAGLDADAALKQHTAEWIVRQGEDFYLSLGFDSLPRSFWQESSLYPVPPDAGYKKNTHASAWNLDRERDVRSLMSVEPNREWYETVHHELGHIYYFLAYNRPEVPIVLREGANRAFHEAFGSMIGLASLQRRFLADRGLVPPTAQVDTMAQLLKEALQFVVFIPFSAGTMTRFEHALYVEHLPADRLNAKWWDLVRTYQGIVPPTPRDESFADGLTKTHINDDPAQYYDYALSFALLIQMHEHIAQDILHQNAHDTDYYGHREAGDFLRKIMAPGASRPWREVLEESTGRALDAQRMVEYFRPLEAWLRRQNRGRAATLPEL